ncbi:MAG: chorismate mutase [Actinomycetota bacterium]
MSNLNDLRQQIDDIDAAIIELLAQRMEVCRDVAALKAQTNTAVIQPQRVREVLTTRRQWAIDNDVDPDFAEQLFRILLSETHRIERGGEHVGDLRRLLVLLVVCHFDAVRL